jgi:hypothetical protein
MTDHDTAKYKIQITLDIAPANRYGDPTGDGQFRFTKEVSGTSLSELIQRVETALQRP